jgi:hypothetical protein
VEQLKYSVATRRFGRLIPRMQIDPAAAVRTPPNKAS